MPSRRVPPWPIFEFCLFFQINFEFFTKKFLVAGSRSVNLRPITTATALKGLNHREKVLRRRLPNKHQEWHKENLPEGNQETTQE